MTAYYNEIDPYAAQWLRNLMAENLIAKGEVDERSITEVQPGDLAGFDQCHFFAGIGGWSLALRLAGWPDNRPVWTGSCPCQPFSVAGAKKGFADERHLWPVWQRLIAERHPATVFGEQVASAAQWLNLVRSDLEALGYAVGALPIQAACAGAFHLRDRFWFVADASGRRFGEPGEGEIKQQRRAEIERNGALGYSESSGRSGQSISEAAGRSQERVETSGMADTNRRNAAGREFGETGECAAPSERRNEAPERGANADIIGGFECSRGHSELTWTIGPGGKARPVKPGIRLLADGVPARVGKLRAFGNAIVPQVAAEFIKAYGS